MALCCVGVALSGNPGIRFRITESGVTKFVDFVKEVTEKSLAKVTDMVPMINEQAKAKGVEIETLEFTKTEMPEVKVDFKAPDSIVIDISGGDLQLSAKGKMGPKEGGADISLGGFKGNMEYKLKAENGKPQITSTSCELSLENVDVKITGFDDSNGMKKKIEGMTKGAKAMIKGMACQQINGALNQLNQRWQMYPMKAPFKPSEELPNFPKDYLMDYTLVNDPKVTDTYMELDFKGCVSKLNEDRMAVVFEPKPLVDKSKNDHPVHFFISDAVANRMLSQLFEHGELETIMPKPDGEKVKASLIKHQEEMGWDVAETDEVSLAVKFNEAPNVHFTEEKSGVITDANVALTTTVKRDDKVVAEPTLHLTIKTLSTISITNKDDTPVPDMNEKVEVLEYKITKWENVKTDLDDAKKAKIEENLKVMLQEMIDGHIKTVKELRTQEVPSYVLGTFTSKLFIAFYDHTMEMAADIDVDVEKSFEEIEKYMKEHKPIPLGPLFF